MNKGIGSSEIILIAESVAREKNISKEAVLEALEESLRVAARRKYGHESSIKAVIDRRTGDIKIYREMIVVEDNYEPIEISEEELTEEQLADPLRKLNPIKISDAKHKKEDAQVGDVILDQLPPIDLGRVAAQAAKQVISYKVREVERANNYEEFKDRVGKIVSGVIEKTEREGVIIKVGGAEALMPNEYLMPGEKKRLRQGERIRALVYEVNKENRGSQILLSRTHNEFVAELFNQEVPEIYDRIIEIKSIARDPGARAKVAVCSTDPSIDPVGSCVGMRGARVQAVINELGGERIDVIEWANDPATTIINALSPAEVAKVVIDEEGERIEVVVPDDQLSIAIGKRGQNVRLASELIGWEIDVLTEESESKRRNLEFTAVTNKFMSALDLEEILAQLLASEGYSSIQSLADANVADLAAIEGLDEDVAQELISRAQNYAETNVDAQTDLTKAASASAKVNPKVYELDGMTEAIAAELYASDVKTLEDIADLANDELLEKMISTEVSIEVADRIIMSAREKVLF